MEFKEFLDLSIKNKKHIVNSPKFSEEKRKVFLEEIFDFLKKAKRQSNLSEKDFNKIVNEKLQFQSKNFNANQFAQAYCELCVFAHFPAAKYERKNPLNKKDVDVTYSCNCRDFNIEVKCPIPNEKNPNSISIEFLNRAPSKSDIDSIESDIKKRLPAGTIIERTKTKDNTLKDFILQTQEKCSGFNNEKDVNILFICCDDEIDLMRWRGYLYEGWANKNEEENGKFILDPKNFKNVDMFIFSNLYFRYKKYFDFEQPRRLGLDDVFCLIYGNSQSDRYSSANKELFIQDRKILSIFLMDYAEKFDTFQHENKSKNEIMDLAYFIDKYQISF